MLCSLVVALSVPDTDQLIYLCQWFVIDHTFSVLDRLFGALKYIYGLVKALKNVKQLHDQSRILCD